MATTITTQNPFNEKPLNTYSLFTKKQLETVLQTSQNTFLTWRETKIKKRCKLLKKLKALLLERKNDYALLMAQEMGKPITQGVAEIEKCAWLCDFYRKNSEDFLADDIIKTEAHESFISYDPLGIILSIMPWNYPFWQVLRFAVPTLTAGNTAVLKHASNVTGCALEIEKLFKDAGYPKGCFTTILANHKQIETLINDNRIKAVSLTGSETAGRKIAEIAGKNLKKCVLELGGNNACVVLNDADLDTHINTMVTARMQNNGQSCIAAKRFIVEEGIYDTFIQQFQDKIAQLNTGNPEDNNTEISVLARTDLAEELEHQVKESIKQGAIVSYGNKRMNAYYQPTIVTNVTPEMPVFKEETFGPVAAIIKVKNKEEAYKMASLSKFGLGCMVFTKDTEDALARISQIEDGAFFINEMVKSDPRLPFGGTKASGYGRELSKEGILEFVNKKTVYLK
ncbi:NAD-dependent succinate-semialdehyde dehydrogenase [Mangrovimonas cancribranchiae]|uniref:NAD-dependent succinate-semialdehyde dehydrogenase n=1 Tax=Mangrovimonas cancribranchiae TaxID=3080055 RepID=A0AAU6P4J7_9FLAO